MEEQKGKEQNMRKAISLAFEGMRAGKGGPFGAVVVKDGKVIGQGSNRVLQGNDPTAHAEVEAIRDACRHLNHFQLTGCTLYTSCEPCPMCLGAIYWARPDKVYYACDRQDAAKAGFDDDFIYREIPLDPCDRSIRFEQLQRKEALPAFEGWVEKKDRTPY